MAPRRSARITSRAPGSALSKAFGPLKKLELKESSKKNNKYATAQAPATPISSIALTGFDEREKIQLVSC